MKRLIIILILIGYAQVPVSAQQLSEIDTLLEHSFQVRGSAKDSSLALAQEAFKKAIAAESENRQAAARVMMGVYYRLSRPDTAVELLRLASAVLTTNDYSRFGGLANWYLGKIHSNFSDYRSAMHYYQAALQRFEALNDPYFQASVISDFAIAEGKQSNYVKALEYTSRAYDIKIRNGLPADAELNNLAIIYTNLRDFVGARKVLWKILKTQQTRDTTFLSYTYNSLGSTYQEEMVLDSAQYYFLAAERNARWNSNIESRIIAMANVASVDIKAGRHQAAGRVLQEAEAIGLDATPFVRQILEAELARLYLASGRLESALEHAKAGLQLARNTHSKKYASDMAAILSETFDRKHQTDSALTYFRVYAAYKDSLVMDEQGRRYNDLRFLFDTSEKVAEIQLLKKQAEIDRANTELLALALTSATLVSVLFVAFLIYRSRAIKKQNEAENLHLQQQLDQRQQDLSSLTLQMIQRQIAIQEIEDEVKKMLTTDYDARVQRLASLITVARSLDKEWETFNQYFKSLHGDFYSKLQTFEKQLTISETRLCALIKMRLPNREIANLLNIETGSVKMAKYRLKKKLRLSDEDDLDQFILGL